MKKMDFHVASILFLVVSWGTALLFLIINFTGYIYASRMKQALMVMTPTSLLRNGVREAS